ncbi:MAG: class F sortase [Nocardioides sp.]
MPWRAVVGLAVAGLALVALGFQLAPSLGLAGHASTGASAEVPGTSPTSETPVVPARRVGALRPEAPSRVVLPDGRVVPVSPADVRGNGSLAVPDDIATAGWWRGGARLGDPFGSTLIAAHVDSFTQGLGPFASLLSVTRGATLTLSSPHLREEYRVSSLTLVPRGQLRSHPELFSGRGKPRLTLVTCAGPYDPARGGYQNLAVITALPHGDVARRAGR